MIIESHTLIPHRPNWSQRPSGGYIWKSELSASQENKEERAVMRDTPFIEIEFLLTPWNDIERGYLEPMLLEATKSGYACVPWIGKAEQLATAATGTSATFVSVANLSVGQYLFFSQPERYRFTSWEASQIDSITDETVTLADALTDTYADGVLVWPLFFGKLTSPNQKLLNSWRGSFEIAVEKQTA